MWEHADRLTEAAGLSMEKSGKVFRLASLLSTLDELGYRATKKDFLKRSPPGLSVTRLLNAAKSGNLCKLCNFYFAHCGVCVLCGNTEEGKKLRKKLRLENIQNTNLERHGVSFPGEIKGHGKKLRATNIERYGVAGVLGNPDIRERYERTMIERYGVSVPLKSEDIRKKHAATCVERYGVEQPMYIEGVPKKIQKTNKAKYGAPYASRNPSVKQKARDTCLDRYGVEHPFHVPEILAKRQASGFKLKDFHHEGRVLKLQGAEPKAAEYLVDKGAVLYPIRRSIPYLLADGSKHSYHPDFLARLEGEKFVVEVKVPYTGFNPQALEMNICKFQAAKSYCKERDLKFMLVVVEKDNVKTFINPTSKRLVRQSVRYGYQ